MPISTHDTRWATLVETLCDLADGYYRAGHLSAALHLLEQGDELLRGPTRDDVLPRERHRLAVAKGRIEANRIFLANRDYELALLALQPVVDRAAEEGDPQSAAAALDAIGLTLYYRKMWRDLGGYDLALDSFTQALAQREALGDTQGIAESLFHIGLCHERLEQYAEAEEFYTRTQATAQAHGHTLEESYAARHLAGAAAAHGDMQQSLHLYERSLALREEAGYVVLLPLSLEATGRARAESGDREAALADYTRAVEIARTIETPVPMVFCLLALGTLRRDLNDAAGARAVLEEALSLARSVDLHRGIESATSALATLT